MPKQQDNMFINILCNIILPVLILNKASRFFPFITPSLALVIALAFPFFYGLRSYIKEEKVNWFSVIGLVGVLLTGGLALLQLKGIYFVIKEAAFPLLLALITLGSVLQKKPLMRLMFNAIFDKDLILLKTKEGNKEKELDYLMNETTLYFAGSFLISAILNFIVATHVFQETESLEVLNEQIAKMTWLGYIVIAAPLSIITFVIIWRFISQLKKITNLSLEDLFSKDHPSLNGNLKK